MVSRFRTIGVGLAVIAGCGLLCESASAQWRTRYVRRDGLFHVEKYHTGNGITPTGGNVLIAGINAFAPLAAAAIGREAPEDLKPRGTDCPVLPADYVEAQRQANALLEQTARLLNMSVPSNTSNNSNNTAPTQQIPTNEKPAVVPPAEFGTKSPWAPRP